MGGGGGGFTETVDMLICYFTVDSRLLTVERKMFKDIFMTLCCVLTLSELSISLAICLQP